ncbi:hypothetical protein Micbo1qcDRAFT_167687, partial [Microdochium bolleyi]
MTVSFAKLLLTKGADIEARDNRGWTPLMHAVAEHSAKGVEFLIEHGAQFETLHDCCDPEPEVDGGGGGIGTPAWVAPKRSK